MLALKYLNGNRHWFSIPLKCSISIHHVKRISWTGMKAFEEANASISGVEE
jgi:hypothetical protein